MELLNRNLYPQATSFSYSCWLHVTTFGADPGKHDSFSHTEYFNDDNLLEARAKAIQCYYDTLKGLKNEGKYFLPFASPTDFIMGQHAAYSLAVFMIHTYGDDIEEYALLGWDNDENEDTLEMEHMIFEQLGFISEES